MKIRVYYGQDTRADSWQTCGSGILIEENFFANNIGLKRHNGGAGLIRCIHILTNTEDEFTYLSGNKRDYTWYKESVFAEEVQILDDPSVHLSTV